MKKILVISDYAKAEKLFKLSTFSNRINSDKSVLDLENSAKRYGFDKMAKELGLKPNRVTKTSSGIAAGAHRCFVEILLTSLTLFGT